MAVLDEQLFGRSAHVQPAVRDRIRTRLASLPVAAAASLRGLSAVPDELMGVLRHVGVPLAPSSDLRWGEDIMVGEVARPERREAVLVIPDPAALLSLSSLALKPLRGYVAERLGVRLQVASGIGLYLWGDHALLVSGLDLPLAGFLYGPGSGQRHGINLEPGGTQVIQW